MPSFPKAVTAASLNRPLRESLIAAAEVGAQGLQFDARTELRPTDLSATGCRQFLKMAGEMNLRIPSLSFTTRRTFYDTSDLDRRIAAVKTAMDFAYQLGSNVLALRVGRIPTDSESIEYLTLRDALNDIARHGNHVGVAPVITPSKDAPAEMGRLLDEITTGPAGIDFDPAGFVMTGHSPIEALRALHDRIFHVQARDALQDVAGTGIEVPLGRGEIDWLEFIATLDEIAYRGWLTVTRTQGTDLAGDAARAIKYLNNIQIN